MILYFGNKLSRWGRSYTVIESLTPLLASHFVIKSFSDKRHPIHRMFDMVFNFLRHKKITTVVLIDSYSTMAFWYTFILAFLCKTFQIPYIPILHGGDFPRRMSTSRFVTRLVFNNAELIVSPSGYLRRVFAEYGYEVECIPNSISVTEFPLLLRRAVTGKILWVRSFDEIYNPAMAIEVLRRLKNYYPSAMLCMVGGQRDSSLHHVLNKIKEYDLSDSVVITGAMSKAEWVKMSREYDVFINTSSIDNTPISVLEAMCLGIPIVSTNVGGIPFLISHEENGLLVDADDSEEMANSICRLIDDASFASALALAARSRVENFDWPVVQRRWFAVLRQFETQVVEVKV